MSKLSSVWIKGEGAAKGTARGLRISHIMSRYGKAEFCVVIGGEGGQGTANITLRSKMYVAGKSPIGTHKRWPLAALEG